MDTLEKIIIPIIPIIGILVSIFVAYWTAKKVYKSEIDNGKVLLLEIIKRYVVNLYNNFDKHGKLKTYQLARNYYLHELEAINSDLNALYTNPLLIKTLKKHSSLT
ncbi:MAG TPA: hypothetical protein PLW77_02635 [Bacteroidales bacterium]|nr:hypothetical protein [Bacteroidales bacterium]HQB22152.1 hypothetical protein [Bacteroidales bacterium]